MNRNRRLKGRGSFPLGTIEKENRGGKRKTDGLQIITSTAKDFVGSWGVLYRGGRGKKKISPELEQGDIATAMMSDPSNPFEKYYCLLKKGE